MEFIILSQYLDGEGSPSAKLQIDSFNLDIKNIIVATLTLVSTKLMLFGSVFPLLPFAPTGSSICC